MSTRLARPQRHLFSAAWYAVPLLWIGCLCAALLLAAATPAEPLQADVPTEAASMPAAA